MCHEYGWTLDQCFNITREQVEMLAEAINKRQEGELEFDASIHGTKLEKTSKNTTKLETAEDFDRLKQRGIIK